MRLRGGMLYDEGKFSRADLTVGVSASSEEYDIKDLIILPGLADVHVHLREPGFSYKETVLSGTKSAAKGGFTSVCAMPNLKPVPDNPQALKTQLEIISKSAVVRVHPFGAITVGEKGEELSDMRGMAYGVVGYSDDGKGVQNSALMEEAMLISKNLGKVISAHCEDESLIAAGWSVNAGHKAEEWGLIGNDAESEYRQIARDIELVAKTGAEYHVCHISAVQSVSLIREAKKSGLPVTCETAPHYLCFTDDQLKDEGRFKMNPPIRTGKDRDALLEGICDGTIDVIATDHAPHSAEEKSGGLRGSLNGVVGLETSFGAVYKSLVLGGYIKLERLTELMSVNARRIFRLGDYKELMDYTVVDINREWKVESEKFYSKGKATPFDGEMLTGLPVMTIVGGKAVYRDERYFASSKK